MNTNVLQISSMYIPYGRKFWRGIYFGGLAVLRAIHQYFFRQNLCNHMVFPLNKPGCARPIDLSSAWSSQLTAAQGHHVSKEFCTQEVEEEREEAKGNPNGVVYAIAVKTDVEIIVGN